ncbi:MAG: hypothetical protein IJB10_00995 [Clostridia bacterium]|nr:hypothetical protein [Clostridia bacterium]
MTLPLIYVGLTLILMLISIVCDWKIKIKNINLSLYWIILLISAVFCLIFGFCNFSDVFNLFINNSAINPLKILIIFISLTTLSVLLDEIGFFKYLAHLVLHKAKTSQTKLFICFYLIISLLTIVTSNDIIILTFTPFICYFAKQAEIDPTPYIVSEFVAANTWSTFLIIGNPTNIYLATSFNINFVDYFLNMALPTLCASSVSFLLLFLIFRKKLKQPIEIHEDTTKITMNKTYLTIGLIGLSSCIVLMAISSYINIEMWYIPLFCSFATFIACYISTLVDKRRKRNFLVRALKKAPYSLIPFLLSMSIIILVLNNCGFINIFAGFIDGKNIILIGIISFVLANIINNIPMTMFFASVFQNCALLSSSMIYSSIMASNICAFFTPIGALAGIMFMKILKQNKIKFSYGKFIAYGTIIAIPTLLTGLGLIYLL